MGDEGPYRGLVIGRGGAKHVPVGGEPLRILGPATDHTSRFKPLGAWGCFLNRFGQWIGMRLDYDDDGRLSRSLGMVQVGGEWGVVRIDGHSIRV